jgi:YfiH family protein
MTDAFRWTIIDAREYLECVPLAPLARHLFSTRQLALPADPVARRANLDQFACDLGVAPTALVRARQVHGSVVLVVGVASGPRELPDADAIVSGIAGTACAVQIADCVPILIAGGSEVRGFGGSEAAATAVGAVHAGWRGTAAGVAAEAVRALDRLGAAPSTLVAAIGPSIRACCYQVDARVRDAFAASPHWPAAEPHFAPDGPGHWRLDVAGINRGILEHAGVPPAQIFDSGLCTACEPGRFYSYRTEGAGTGRLVAGIVAS